MSARILIVDDEESIRFTFERFLRAAGYVATTAVGCAEALARLDEASFDVIFVDIILDDGTGIELLRTIKERGLICPVLMITGEPGVATAADSIRLGAFDYIPKPINQEALLGLTRTAVKYKAVLEEKERIRANLEAIFRSVRDAIITVDQDAVLTEYNEAAMTLCGYTRDDIGRPFSALMPRCEGGCREMLESALTSGAPVEADHLECRRGDGPARVVSIRTYPLLAPQGVPSGVVMVLRDDTHVVGLERELTEHRQFHRIIGQSEPMQRVYTLIKALAGVQTTVLITGESGTGKELVAEALHLAGDRSRKPLVKVNCSALPEALLEAELFGHVKGAFTGAIRDNEGRFCRADGGTIFFDEIGELSPQIQVKLLRVLEESEFERVGSSTSVKVNVRLIAATNRDLQEKVRLGEIRADLYYRLKVVEIRLPPLRDRREDIPLLLEHFRAKFNTQFKKQIEAVSADVLKAFTRYPWPGNVRELEHTMEHAFVLCNQNIITLDHLPTDFLRLPGMRRAAGKAKQDDALATLAALNKTAWNKAKAARLLGVDRVTLYRRIKKFNLSQEPVPS